MAGGCMKSEVLKRAEEALEALDVDNLIAAYADDFLFEDTSLGERITSKTALKEYFERLFTLPGVRFSDVKFFPCGEKAWGTWTWSGKSIKAGKDYSIQGASLFVLGDDKIIEEKIFYDPRSAYE
ncbi:MAG: nuclear transport factor 2 family protein [Anaerolineales bacterium]|nr:MAG: nuclear transport factor 2 family protein [Anaerolineales bacterium]